MESKYRRVQCPGTASSGWLLTSFEGPLLPCATPPLRTTPSGAQTPASPFICLSGAFLLSVECLFVRLPRIVCFPHALHTSSHNRLFPNDVTAAASPSPQHRLKSGREGAENGATSMMMMMTMLEPETPAADILRSCRVTKWRMMDTRRDKDGTTRSKRDG